jgi:hypothetical protein
MSLLITATHIHELPDWPRFIWNHEAVAAPLASARHKQGRLFGQMEALGFKVGFKCGGGRSSDAHGRCPEEQRD